jgi:hypothetical protein
MRFPYEILHMMIFGLKDEMETDKNKTPILLYFIVYSSIRYVFPRDSECTRVKVLTSGTYLAQFF